MNAKPSPRHTGPLASATSENRDATARPEGRIPTTQERRRRMDALTWGAILFSVVVHFFVLNVLPDFDAPDFTAPAGELEVAELPPEVEIPPPPEAIARPAVPVVADDFEVDPDITIAPTTFAANPVEELPPPPEEKTSSKELYEAPTFTPYSVAPDLINRREAAAAVVQAWPQVLKDAGIEGVVVVWIFIDEEGEVRNTQVSQGSGIPQLDDAALRAAEAFRFSPALNRENAVPVWVELPITFTFPGRQAG